MKKTLLLFLSLFYSIMIIAQSDSTESVKPTFGVELDRKVSVAIIEEKVYRNIIVELDAADLGEIFSEGVKIIVKDAETGKRLYKKRFSKSYLYAFSNGTIQVGKGNALTQLILYKVDEYGIWALIIREKGIY